MSSVLTPFLVDLKSLRQAVGSRDESLIAAVIEKNPDLFRPQDPEYDHGIPASLALRHLVMGESPNTDEQSAGKYGFALEALCNYLGERILPDCWGGVSWLALADSGVEDVLTRSGPPVPLPDLQGAMTIGHLTAAEVAAELSKTDRPEIDDEDLQELVDEYQGWLQKAASKKKDVVFIYR
jgi:hypothetical protein